MLVPEATFGFELFGQQLESASRDPLRAAVRQAGVTLVRQGGDTQFYDIYDSSAVFKGSRRLYLGFVKKTQQFAFAEYEFEGLEVTSLLQDLVLKYGETEIVDGDYISDRSYRWQRDGIQIKLRADWPRNQIQLSYSHPENLSLLRLEQSEMVQADIEQAKIEQTSAETEVSVF